MTKRKVVSNTGPLIALATVNHLNLLEKLFSSIIVPQAVHDEITAGGLLAAGRSVYEQATWIEVVEPVTPDPLLLAQLDEGEAAVITLARIQDISLVLMDEQKGRKIARSIYGLEVIGSARVLVEAKQQGLLKNVGKTIQAMRDNGYWIHERIVHYALEKAGELK